VITQPIRSLSSMNVRARSLALLLSVLAGCASTPRGPTVDCPIPGAEPADELIADGEQHFARLWRLTRGGENAEAYWSDDGKRLSLQRRNPAEGIDCDRIFVTREDGPGLVQVSSGRGATTCSYFLPGGQEVLFASTQGHMQGCPPKPDYSQGYVWMLHPEFDIYVRDLLTGRERTLISDWGYDAEATVSTDGREIVFTSTRSGDIELWTCRTDGSRLRQVTHQPGYDGGAFFSHDGKQLVFRATIFDAGQEAEQLADYQRLLKEWKIRPNKLEIFTCDRDGENRKQVTQLGAASFAPYFYPDDQRILFASNYQGGQRNFDLWAIDADGSDLERVTNYDGFDSFPMFSPCGRFLVFASNRGGEQAGETSLYVALWK
jgi:Tol biopolymer transport system component